VCHAHQALHAKLRKPGVASQALQANLCKLSFASRAMPVDGMPAK